MHDAILIEARLEDLDDTVAAAQAAMSDASALVLDGFRLRSDAKIIRYPERYEDERGKEMWQRVWGVMAELAHGSGRHSMNIEKLRRPASYAASVVPAVAPRDRNQESTSSRAPCLWAGCGSPPSNPVRRWLSPSTSGTRGIEEEESLSAAHRQGRQVRRGPLRAIPGIEGVGDGRVDLGGAAPGAAPHHHDPPGSSSGDRRPGGPRCLTSQIPSLTSPRLHSI